MHREPILARDLPVGSPVNIGGEQYRVVRVDERGVVLTPQAYGNLPIQVLPLDTELVYEG